MIIKNSLKIGVPERDYTVAVSRGGQLDRTLNGTDDVMMKKMVDISEISVTYVDSVAEKVLVKEEVVHGVKISTYNNISYDVYSNGYKEISNIIESFEIDNSGYNGNTASLKNQAIENIELYYDKIKAVLEYTNQYRKENGVDILTLDKNLCVAASVRALEMSYTENLSHVRPDGAKCFFVLEDLNINYKCAGENIGDGFKKEDNVCKAWKKSESHYRNMVSSKYNKVGIGIARSLNGRYYWVQIFSD